MGNMVPSQMTPQDLLNAMDGIAYLTAEDGQILAVSATSWTVFSEANEAPHLKPDTVIGSVLFDLILGEEIRKAYTAMHKAVWDLRHADVSFAYRCDAPDVERHMRLSISAVKAAGQPVAILYQSQVVDEVHRPPMHIFSKERLITNFKSFSEEQIVTLCSYCHDVAWPIGISEQQKDWIKPEEYYRRSDMTDVVVSHGMCPSCYADVVLPNS